MKMIISVLLVAAVLLLIGLEQGARGRWSRASLLIALAAGICFAVLISLATVTP